MQTITNELESKLHDVISDYVNDHPEVDGDDLHASMNVILDAVISEDDPDLTVEGGIEAHYDHLPKLRDSLLAAL